jgi:hypothetical protein
MSAAGGGAVDHIRSMTFIHPKVGAGSDFSISRRPCSAALPRSSRDSFAAERFEIVLVPSVAAWLRLRAAEKGRAGLALALVDPSPESDRVLGEVPLPGARREAEHAVAFISTRKPCRDREGRFGDLLESG